MNDIKTLTQKEKDLLLSKSAYSLPDNPSDKHFSPSQVRRKMYEGLLVLFDYINDIISQINTNVGLDNALNDQQEGRLDTLESYFENGIAKKATADESGNNVKSTYAADLVEIAGSKSATYQKKYFRLKNKLGEEIRAICVDISAATTEYAGLLTAADKAKVDTINNRVEKITQNNKVYITGDTGEQTSADYDSYASGAFVRRNDGGGHIYVPSTPTASTHAASKSYADTVGGNATSAAKTYTDSKVARTNLVSVLGEASQSLNGLMSAQDKTRLDTLFALLADDDDDTVVDTIKEVLNIFNNYQEGADLVNALALKVNIADIVDSLTSSSSVVPLSANQGKVLKDAIDDIVDGTTVVAKATADKNGNDIVDTYMNRTDAFSVAMVEVSDYNESTGEVTLTYNSNGVSSIVYDDDTGVVTFTY